MYNSLLAIVAILLVVTCLYSGYKGTMNLEIRNNYSLADLMQDTKRKLKVCEESLPRNQHCDIVLTTKVVDND